MSVPRPLRVELKKDDVLYLLHIPKTAGSSLFHVIAPQFSPLHVRSMSDRPLRDLSKDLGRFRFIRGHYDYALHEHLPRKPIYLTMLREPMARTLSLYEFVKRTPDSHWHAPVMRHRASLHDFVFHAHTYHEIVNPQTYRIAAHKHVDPKTVDDEAMLALAKRHLDAFAFFGLQERFAESVELLTYTFGWRPVVALPRKHIAPQPVRPEEITPETRAAIEARTRLDADLHRYAAALFDARYRQMQAEREAGLGQPPVRLGNELRHLRSILLRRLWYR